MALINCPECKKEISDKAASCPNCGNPIENNTESVKEVFKKEKCKYEITMDDKYLSMPLLPVSIIIITTVISQFINLLYIFMIYSEYTSEYFVVPFTNTVISFIILIIVSYICNFLIKNKKESFFKSYGFAFLVFMFNIISLGFIQNAEKYSKVTDIITTSVLSFLFLGLVIIIVGFFATFLSSRYKKEKNRINEIFLYLQTNLPLLNNFDTRTYRPLNIITLTNIKNKDEMLFEMYKRAYLLDADAIVLNSENTTTHTSIKKNNSTTTVTYSLTATPLKYIF